MSKPNVISIDGVNYVREDSVVNKPLGDEVIIRTYSAGVHIGTIKSKDSSEVTLINARRLWKWAGAFTLNEVAMYGVNRDSSRICKPVSEITVQWIEIIPVAKGVDLSTTEK
jgi:hypothetical protein